MTSTLYCVKLVKREDLSYNTYNNVHLNFMMCLQSVVKESTVLRVNINCSNQQYLRVNITLLLQLWHTIMHKVSLIPHFQSILFIESITKSVP